MDTIGNQLIHYLRKDREDCIIFNTSKNKLAFRIILTGACILDSCVKQQYDVGLRLRNICILQSTPASV